MDKEKPTTSVSIFDEEKNKPTSSTTKASIASITVRSDGIGQRQHIVQNFFLIWLTADIDKSEEDCQNTLPQLRDVVNDINLFTQPDECIDFLTDIDDVKAFLIVSNTFGQQIVPLIYDVPQLHGIYIVCGTKSEDEQWAKEWVKIKGIYTEIMPVIASLQEAVTQYIYNQNSIAVSFMAADEKNSIQNLNQLEPAFMYTQIFKEILIEMDDNDQSINDFVLVSRNYYINNNSQLNVIAEFERNYSPQSSIKWYTRDPFVYNVLNRALRLMETNTIINMGFFIRHLHRQIEQLYQQQIADYHEQPFVVYRGQGLSTIDFEKLLKTKGGLISFNNFLSTSVDENISFFYAESASMQTEMIGILFKMSIDPSVSSAPFASIREVSYFQTEDEILFSMHTVFRIGEITKIDNNSSLYQVDLKLTADDDQQLRVITDHIREEVKDDTEWERLGHLLLKLHQYKKAEELYTVLLEKTSDEDEKAVYYNQLGYNKTDQGDYPKAIEFYEKALEIKEKSLSPNYLSLAASCNNIAGVYSYMGEYSKALSFYKKALEICQKDLPPDHPHLATSYSNIGLIYKEMGEFSKAFLFYEKALEIQQKILPSNHPLLANSYNNVGEVYNSIGPYSEALSFYEKALEIQQKTLPPDHPSVATTYNNIGGVHTVIGEYSKALSFYERALEIQQKTLSPDHPVLTGCYNNVAGVYYHIGEYSKALSVYGKVLEICQKILPASHPLLAASHNNLGSVYESMGEHLTALSFYEKALEIQQKTLPLDHPLLATSYSNIGGVYCHMEEYPKALSFHKKTLEICHKTLSPDYPLLATYYSKIGGVYTHMGEYSEALSYYKNALEICQKTLPPHHPSLATSYNDIGEVYDNMGEYSKALSFYEKALEIQQKVLPADHPHLATTYNDISGMYDNMGEYSKALSFYEKALGIYQKTLPPNHLHLATSYNNIGLVYSNMGEYSKALSYYELAQDILQNSLPANHPHAQSVRRKIETVKKKLLTHI